MYSHRTKYLCKTVHLFLDLYLQKWYLHLLLLLKRIRLNVILMWKKSDLLCYLKGLSILAWNLRIYYKKKPLRNWDVYSTKGVKGTQKGILKNVLVQSHKELKEISWGTAEQLVPILQSYSGPFFLCPYRICLRVIVVIRTARIC